MTFTAYNTIHEIVTRGTTVKQLKALCKAHGLEVQSSNINGLLATYDNGFKYNRYYLLNVVFFPTVKDELIEELT